MEVYEPSNDIAEVRAVSPCATGYIKLMRNGLPDLLIPTYQWSVVDIGPLFVVVMHAKGVITATTYFPMATIAGVYVHEITEPGYPIKEPLPTEQVPPPAPTQDDVDTGFGSSPPDAPVEPAGDSHDPFTLW